MKCFFLFYDQKNDEDFTAGRSLDLVTLWVMGSSNWSKKNNKLNVSGMNNKKT